MKTEGKQSLMRRAAITILSVMLIVGMMPFYTLTLFGKDSGNAYAAVPSDGTGWTASGANGLKYFQNIYGTGTQVTSLSYGQTLNAGVYYIMNNITLRPQYPDSYKRTSALKINGNVKMIFLNNSSLTVQGGRALGYGEEYWRGSTKYTNWDSNMGGAGAGIELSSGNTLTVDGSGYIYATGGRAGNGQTGERPDGGNDEDSNSRGYHGGYGGRGGGGAGAGIGTKGGNGSTSQGSRGWGDAGDGSATASGGGKGGNGGSSSSSGTFIQYGNVRVSATGGDGGRGGDRGTSRWESQSYRDAHGGGGGGGGAGLPANAIGSGGPGGGAGGGGGGGAVKRDNNGSCAGGSGGGGGGGWDGSQVARGGERGAYDTEKGKTNSYGNDGKDASWDFDGSTFSGGKGGKRKSASSATAGKGGNGGSSGSYGNSGTIVGSNTGNGQQYRIYVDGYTAGGRNSTYCVVPKREITITITENSGGNAKLNPDGKSYLYVPNKAVEPKVVIKHIPTGATLTEDTYNTSVSPRQSYQNYNYYTVYSNNTGAPPSPNPREASVRVLANSRATDQWQRKIVNNDVNGNIPSTAGTLKDIDYKIDYETYKVTLDAAGGIGTRTVEVKLGNTRSTWGPGFDGLEINAPTREGFVFGGFFTEKDGKGIQYYEAINSDVSYARPCKQWTTKGNGTLYAKWIPLTYKIRFWSDYGNGSEYVEYNLKDFVYENPSQPETSAKLKPATYGNLVLPSAHDLGISRDHYDFVGWNIYEEQDWAMYKAGKTYKAGLTTKQDDIVNIYAAWRAKDQLVVSYDANGGSGAPPVDGTWADSDYKISTQVPVREGYTFKGWNSAASPEYDEVTGKQTNGFAYTKGETVKASDTRAIIKSTTLYAQWERNPSVSYRANGGSLETAIPTKYPAKGSTVNIDYGAITRTGYEFVGWHIKGSSDHKVYVENTPAQSKITIDGTEYNLTQATSFEMPAESVVLEALWTPEKMDIDFVTDSKGGEKGLYDLDGWYYADSEGERLPEDETGGIKSVKSLEIEYDKPLSFQVVVDRNKVDDSAFRLRINDINTAPADVEVNDETNIATYKFAVAKVRAGQMIQTAGLVGKTFPVILDANEGELRGTVTSHTFGEATALPTRADSEDADGNTPVKKGFAFDGWYDAETEGEPSGHKVESISAETIATSEDGTFTFHAKWIASKYSIAYNIGPFPGEDGSVLQWQDDVNEFKYKADVDNNAAYKNIPYSDEVTLPALSDYVKYEYGALDEQGQIQRVEAQFLGWATKKSATEPEYSSGQTVRRLTDKDGATVTLYPVWGAPRYKLVLDPNGGKLTEPITGYQAGDTIDLTEVKPVRAGYDFGGWFGEKIEDDADVSEKTPVTSIPASEFGDKTYYAYWTAKTYKFTLKGINLETGEDTGETWESGSLKVGDTVVLDLPAEITAPEGKALAGWTERYNPVTREIPPASEDDDPTIEIIGYVPAAVLFTAGEETADLWTADGDEFAGRVLYPVWKNDGDETLIYDANGGQEAPDMVEATRDSEIDVDFENAPKRKGYIFAGYDTDKTRAYDSTDLEYPADEPAKITLDKSKRLYAIWEPVAYDITFDAAVADSEENVGFDDGSGNWSKTMTQKVDEYDEEVALSSKTPSRGSMYEFLGWSTVKNGQVEYQPGSIVSQFADVNGSELTGKTLYAIWLTKDPAYLSFDAMGGIGAPSMETHPQGTEVSVKADDESRDRPTYHGYTFKGWGTSSEDPAGTRVEKVNMPNEVKNITLYAIWEKNQSIRLVYDSGSGATGSVPTDPTSYYEGETASVLYRPAPSKTGYEFLGWNVVNEDGETVRELRKANEDDTSLEITDELIGAAGEGQLILKAAFKANEYTVSFDGNGAKSGDAPAAITKKYNDGEVEMPKHNGEGEGDGSLVAPTGFSFAGWNTEKDGSGTMLQAGQVNWELSTAANDEVTLYAIWTAAATNVVFDNGDSNNYQLSFEYGQVLPDNLNAPKKTGYDFKYYYIEEYSHNADGDYLNAAGEVVQTQEEAEVLKTKYYDDSMEPLKKWEMTADDLRFQVGGGDTFNMKAEWEAQTYMISYHDDKGVLVSSQEITYGKDFRVADASDLEVPSGYRHVGWKFKNDPEQLTPDIQADKGITPTKANGLYNNGQTVSVYAVFQEIRKFKVTYDANGGTDAPQDTKQYEPGEKAIVGFEPVPKRANYDFLGWTTYSNTSSVLPGGANAGKYYADSTIDGVETIDGYTYHYGEEGGSNTQKEINIEMRNDVKFYAVWVPKTYYTVDFYGNSTSNGGDPNKVTAKNNTFTGPDNRTYTKSASNDGFRTDEAIFRSTSPYKGDKSTKIKLPDGSQMFNNTNDGAKFMGWSRNADAKVADYKVNDELEDLTMDENIVLSAVWAYPVRKVTLTDIEKPVYGNAPSEDVEATAASGVAVTKSTWTPSTDAFAAGVPYKLTVKMKATDGYYFDNNKLPSVEMNLDGNNGKVDAEVSLNAEGNVLTATYTFVATENIIVNGDKDENKTKPIAITDVNAPEAGKTLDNGGNAGDKRVDNDSWFPAVTWTATDAQGQPKDIKTNAEPDTIYTATVRLKVAKGYEFNADVTKVTFIGEEVPFSTEEGVTTKATVDAQTGDLIVSYTFPKTAAVDNVINLKLSGSLKNGDSLPDQAFTSANNVDKDSRLSTIAWSKVDGDNQIELSKKDKVAPSTTYVALVELKPADGYTFVAEETAVTFDGMEMTVKPANTETEGNNWAKLTDNGTILVSREFTSSADTLIEIYDPASLSAEYGTKVSDVEDLPREVQIHTENGKRNTDVTWIDEDGKVAVVSEEGTIKLTDAEALNQKREAHTVKIVGTVTIPDGVTLPDEMTATATLTVKVAADPDLDSIELNLEGIKKSGGTLNYNSTFPNKVHTEDVTVDYQDRHQEPDWLTEDTNVISGQNYIAEVTLSPTEGHKFSTRRNVIFDGVVIPITEEKPEKTDENEAEYAYAVLNDDGSITVGRTYQSKNANMTKADELQAVEVAWDAPKTPEGLGLPTTDGIDIDDRNRNSGRETATIASADWNLDNYVSKDLNNREAHEVTVSAVLTMPDGVNDPETETKTVTVTVKVAADPRLVPEAEAAELESTARTAMENVTEESSPRAQRLKAVLEESIGDMNDYIADLENSTVKGIEDEITKVRKALADLEEETVMSISLASELKVDKELPAQMHSEHARVDSDSQNAEITWLDTNDSIAKEDTIYWASFEFKPADGKQFYDGSFIKFEDDVVITTGDQFDADNPKNSAWVDSETGNLKVVRSYKTPKLNLASIDTPAALNAKFGDDIATVGLAETVNAKTNAGDRALTVNWNTEDINLGDVSSPEVRKAHDVKVSGVAVLPDSITNDDNVSLEVFTTIHVAADPRLEKEAAAAKLDKEAKEIINKAKNAGAGANEIAELEEALQAMRDEVSAENLPNSTAESDQAAIDAVNTKLKALKKAISDKEEADRKAAEEADRKYVNGGKKTVLVAKGIANGATAVDLSWNNVSADRYLIYFAKCNAGGKEYKCTKIKAVNGKTLKFKKTKLAKNTAYKFYVVAQKKSGGSYKTIATSSVGHFFTGNESGKYTNPKTLTLKKTQLSLKVGKTDTIKGTVTKVKTSKKLGTNHEKLLRFKTTNARIATVNASGKVTAKHKGTCNIYVQTINGMWNVCKITVK